MSFSLSILFSKVFLLSRTSARNVIRWNKVEQGRRGVSFGPLPFSTRS